MKAFSAALVAVCVLYVIDKQYNDGRYTATIEQAVNSLVPR
jgi:hypothetical protein